MEKFFKIFSTVIFLLVFVGFIGLGIYIYFIKESPKSAVIVPQEGEADPTRPVVVVGDPVEAPEIEKKNLEEYAYKKAETELSLTTILFYLLGALLSLYLLKKVARFWRYLVKNSV